MGNNKKTDACAELKTRIPELPYIMSMHGWGIAARLMDRWLHLGANSVPEQGVHDTTTVQMNWVLSFPIAAEVYDKAHAEKVWVNEAAQRRIEKDLIRGRGLLPKEIGERLEIGNVGEGEFLHPGNWLQFHKNWQVQLREVKQSIIKSPIDELYGALGDFSFYYLVKGWVEHIADKGGSPRYKVTINRVGVYIRDSYDFNGPQTLGFWGCNPIYIGNGLKLQGSSNRYHVTNGDFRTWREKYGRGYGGDFLVFSNIKRFNTNDSFEFSK